MITRLFSTVKIVSRQSTSYHRRTESYQKVYEFFFLLNIALESVTRASLSQKAAVKKKNPRILIFISRADYVIFTSYVQTFTTSVSCCRIVSRTVYN